MRAPRDRSQELQRIAQRKRAATAQVGQAFLRLLHLAEAHDSGQARRIAAFLASTFDGQAFGLDPFMLREVDAAIADDMLACLDALRWAQTEWHSLVPQGQQRVLAVIERHGLKWPDAS